MGDGPIGGAEVGGATRSHLLRVAVVVMVSLVSGCAGRYTPRRPQPITVSRQDGGPPPSACVPSEPRARPSGHTPAASASGGWSLMDMRGDDRLAVAGRFASTWSHDSAHVFTATAERVLVWDGASGVLARDLPLREPLDRVYRVVASPGGKWLAVSGARRLPKASSDTPSTILIDLAGGGQRDIPGLGGGGPGGGLAFSPDGRQLFGGGFHWDLAASRGWRDKAIGVDRRDLPNGRRFITFVPVGEGVARRYVPELRVSPGDELLHRFEPVRFSGAVDVSGDGRRIAILRQHSLRVLSTATFEPLATIHDTHRAGMVSLSHDGRRAVIETLTCITFASMHVDKTSGCAEPAMSVWDLEGAGGPRQLWRSASGSGDQWVFSRDGSVLTGPDTRLVESLRHVDSGDALVFGKRVRSLSPDGRWVLFEGESGLALAPLAGGEASWKRAFEPRLLALSGDGGYRVTEAGGVLRLEGHGTCMTLGGAGFASKGVRFSPDGSVLVAVSHDASSTLARAIDSSSGRPRWTLRFAGAGGRQARVFAAGERLLVQGTDHDEVLQFDLMSGQPRGRGEVPRLSYHTPLFGGATYEVRDVGGDRVSHLSLPALSVDGARVANMAVFDNRLWISVWDLQQPQQVIDQPAGGWPSHIVSSPSGSSWAIGYRNGRIRWLTQDGRRWIDGAASHDGPVTALRFTPSGDQLISAGRDGSVMLFDPSTGAVAGRAMLPLDHATHLAVSSAGEVIAETARRMQVRWRLAMPAQPAAGHAEPAAAAAR